MKRAWLFILDIWEEPQGKIFLIAAALIFFYTLFNGPLGGGEGCDWELGGRCN
jgi:hypothetical protein